MNDQYGVPTNCIAPVEIQEGDLVAFLEGEASSTVARHIARCPACAAEVAALGAVNTLLSQALQRDAQPASPIANRSGQKRTRSSARLSWLKHGFGVAPAALAVVLLLVLTVGITYNFDDWWPGSAPTESIEPPTVAAGETTAPSVVSEAVIAEAANPDVDQRFITQYQTDEPLPSSQAIVESLAGLGRGSAPVEADRHAITRIIDVNIADRYLDEKEVEIAPPLDLRRMLEQQLQAQPDEFLMRVDRFKSKSIVTGQDGAQYLVWADNRSGVTTLYAARSNDGGQSWSEDVQIDRRVGRVFQPALAVDGQGQLYLIWRSWSNIQRSAFYFSHSTDGGQSWSRAIPIDTTPGKTIKPNLAVDTDKGHLYVAWGSDRDTNTDIYFLHSGDLGQTWSSKVRMANIGS